MSLSLEQRIELLETEVRYLKRKLSDVYAVRCKLDEDEYVEKHGEFVDKAVAARLIGVTRATIYQMLKDGRIHSGCGGKKCR